MPLSELTPDELTDLHAQLTEDYDDLVAQGLKLDLTRGKPASAQLDLSNELLTLPGEGQFRAADGTDCRNYGGLTGLPEIREIFAELLDCPRPAARRGQLEPVDHARHAGLVPAQGRRPAASRGSGSEIKFICPVPGYDRHFALCEQFGIEMVPVPLGEHGPDLDAVKELAADPSVKGIWVVPTYANPTGRSTTRLSRASW